VSDETKDGALAAALHAGRAAAAAAAVGAAVGAARAFASRDQVEEPEAETDRQETAEPPDEPEQPEAEDRQEPEPEERRDEPEERRDEPQEPVEGIPAGRAGDIVERARRALHDLRGADAEAVTALERFGDGWRIALEVVELRRVPESTDVLATYAVELDGDGDLVGLQRVRRYYRAQADLGEDS
jgi:Gas vesicle synthesis protein GvpO